MRGTAQGVRPKLVQTVQDLIDRASHEWRLSRRAIWTITAIPFLLPLITIAAGVLHRPTFDLLTGEDSLGEWLQVVAWIGALVITARLTIRHLRSGSTMLGGLYLVLAVAMVFIIGEEISWGQRLLDFGTPEALEEANRQGEANLHNIYGVQTVFSWGMFAVGAYGTLGPAWALRRWGSFASWPRNAQELIPHWLLIPYFLLMLVWRTYRNLFEPIEAYYVAISEFGEITELVLPIGFLLFAWHRWRSIQPAETV